MSTRFDLYTPIHKALRAALCHAQCALGSTDWRQRAQRQATLDGTQALLQTMRAHLGHENDFVHPAMEAAVPGSSQALDHEHRAHAQAIDRLDAQLEALRAVAADQAPALGLAFYRGFTDFVANNLTHMLVEEDAHNRLLWAHLDDAALMALHDRLLASIPPQEMMASLRWMAKGLSVPELADLLNGLRAQPPAFEAALDEVQRWLDGPRQAALRRALNLALVPGLMTA